ncbi:hypothetical protein DKP76_10455 [Falsochrobactrum shanghaiense]|uniref:Uncharacterized protein n=1 Tax=Falsochrobactrum shanghaiense TaxID=2201899 RepID=A0A316JA55_9HYPH|nr:DUF6074 family protein [Falsochrobactrum shanghaiense]PWL18131.1 hypothetical protein DKP76_10455 [Falsochrobactrum shanghaiense]
MNVILFPVEAEVAAIERAAINLDRRDAKSAAKWWQTECRRLHARYTVIGFPDAECRAMVDRFARAVQAELNRMAFDDCRKNGNGGAA